ncbi:DUF4870 domain-containing protein [soil metagenome]
MEDPNVISSTPPPPPVGAVGLADNVAGALAYITIVPAIVFLVLEPYNKNSFIRFHSFQCLALAVCGFVLSFFTAIPILGWILGPILGLVLICVWILCVIKAYQGVRYKLPIIGDFVENLARQ